jgi:hypothetical protein
MMTFVTGCNLMVITSTGKDKKRQTLKPTLITHLEVTNYIKYVFKYQIPSQEKRMTNNVVFHKDKSATFQTTVTFGKKIGCHY